jgi:hypothetical protein
MYPLKYHRESGTSKNDAANYVVELVSQRKAKLDGILLEEKYWQDPVWQKYYMQQKRAAHTLLGLFGESVVVSTVAGMKTVYSLQPKFVKDEMVKVASLKKKQAKMEKLRIEQSENPTQVINANEQTGKGRGSFNGKKSKSKDG